MVVNVAKNFLYLIPTEKQEIVLAACWMHDVIEDCRQTYSDVKEVLNEEVAEIVYAVSNEKGKNRKERANEKYYEGIKANSLAVFVKLCDKIANIQYSTINQSKMLEVYEKEHPYFYQKLYVSEYQQMFEYLEKLLNKKSIF
jgi:(p)ppGpp synthase/HD superfamily hydrolase